MSRVGDSTNRRYITRRGVHVVCVGQGGEAKMLYVAAGFITIVFSINLC